MIRVLQVVGSLNSGGSQSMTMNIYRNIDRNKIQFDFIIHKKNEILYVDEIKEMGGKVYVLPEYKGYNIISFKRAWKKFFKEHPEYKIIHGHVRSTAAIYLKIAKKYGLYTIAHSHSTSSGSGISAIIKDILQYRIRYVADYFMGCSYKANVWLFGNKVANSNRCIILNNGIDTQKFLYNEEIRKMKRKEFKIEKNDRLLGNIGRFDLVKNHKFIIEIFENLCKKDNNYKLMLVGDGKLKPDIEKMVKEKKLENKVIFTGVRNDINELLQAIDIIVMPSIYEGLPVTLIEAQAAGLPCLISDVITDEVNITELIHKENLEKSPNVWGKDIERIFEKSNNRAKNNEQIIKNRGYDIETIVKEIEEIYKRGIEKVLKNGEEL